MKRTMYYSMIRKYLLSLFFAFGLIFDAKCALRFTLDGVPHCITTGKHITINWPPEIKEVKEEGENLLQDAQAETDTKQRVNVVTETNKVKYRVTYADVWMLTYRVDGVEQIHYDGREQDSVSIPGGSGSGQYEIEKKENFTIPSQRGTNIYATSIVPKNCDNMPLVILFIMQSYIFILMVIPSILNPISRLSETSKSIFKIAISCEVFKILWVL